MFITVYAAGMPFNGSTIPDGKSLGGSESAAYFVAKELAALGHTVTVFTSERETAGTWDGVRYEWHGEPSEVAPLGDRFAFAMRAPQDVVIVQRHPHAFVNPPNSKLNIWWLHDLALHRNAPHIRDSLVHTDLVFTVSEFHKTQVSEVYGIDERYIFATKNGVDYNRVRQALAHKPERRKKHLCFASRPERGLRELVGPGGIMETMTDYHLHVCGYDNTTPQMVNLYRYLFRRCEELPNVELHGHLGKDQLYELLASCQAYVYPTMFEDTSNIMALESAACGTPFVGVLNGAIPETCSPGFAKLVKPKKGEVNLEAFAQAIVNVCEQPDYWERLSKAGLEHRQSWHEIANSWDVEIVIGIGEKTLNEKSMIKHLEQQSDIVAMRNLWRDATIEETLPDFKTNYRFLLENDFEAHYKAYYEYEKERGVEYGPESLDGNPRFECIADIVKRINPKTVLDYGCAHGHYTINLAKRMPDTEFDGVDLARSNIAIANKWSMDDDVIDNTHFMHGDHTAVKREFWGYDFDGYDVVIAAEVLEHVECPATVVDALIEYLKPGGTMIVSVPYGPWEAAGYEKHPGWRAHIHHLERQDLKELFSHFDDYKCLALPHGGNLGHYVLTFTKPEDGRKCGKIDYVRKGWQQAPRQSLSVCMIAKDEEDNIGRCLKSIAPYADEIIIGIDKTTVDQTKQIAIRYGAECVEIPKVTGDDGIGFDEARNITIGYSKSDWILWIDADETIENVHLLPSYLRQNPYDGYMVKQHHYSAEPSALLQTDFPVRLFRNNNGVKFFGVVHEHPSKSTDMNAGPGNVYLIPNIHIMHTGYATESKRRQRFARNFPLMQRDREKHPDRILGKFLMVRDLTHLIRYERENNRGQITDKAMSAAINAIELWSDLLENGETHSRYIIDSIPYYSECVKIVTNGDGIEYRGSVNDIEIKGIFPNVKIIENMVLKLVKASTKIHTEKYF